MLTEFSASQAAVDKRFKSLTHALKASPENPWEKFKTEDSDWWMW